MLTIINSCNFFYIAFSNRFTIITPADLIAFQSLLSAAAVKALKHSHSDNIFHCLQPGTHFTLGWSEEIHVKCLSQGHNVDLPRPGFEPISVMSPAP